MSATTAASREPAASASRQRILETAIQLIGAHGVEGMSLQRLADEVGLHKSTLFHHFRSKEEVCDSAVRLALDPLVELFPLADDERAPALEELLERVRALADHFEAEPGTARFLLRCILDLQVGQGPDVTAEDADHPIVQMLLRLGSWLDRARRAGAIRKVRVRQALLHLLGLILFYPAITDGSSPDLPGRDAQSESARREELSAAVRGAFAPEAEK